MKSYNEEIITAVTALKLRISDCGQHNQTAAENMTFTKSDSTQLQFLKQKRSLTFPERSQYAGGNAITRDSRCPATSEGKEPWEVQHMMYHLKKHPLRHNCTYIPIPPSASKESIKRI